jgi:hypothetical protein
LLDVVYASKLTVPWNSLYGTVLDPHFLEKKTAMLSAEEDGPAELSGTQTKRDAEILEYSDDTEGRLRQYGQGIVVGKGEGSDRKQHALILSNRHVIDGLALNTPGISIRYDKQNRDLAIALFPHVQVDPEAMVRLPEHLSDNKIKGQFIVLTGIKPDVTSVGHGAGSEESGASVTGRKTYGGIAIHLNHQLIEALFPRMPTEAEMTQLLQSFIVEVPTSQSLDNEGHAHHITEATFRGMSGSPVFVFLNGKYHFCGVIASIFQKIDTRGQVHSFAVFYGPDAVNAFFRDSTPSTLEGVFGPDKVSAVPPQPQTQNDPGSQNQD